MGTGGTGGTDSVGDCTRSCTTAADCCPPGVPDCPSDQYPANYTCTGGLCGPPTCQSHEDCVSPETPTDQCVAYNGLKGCVTPCTMDSDCTPAKCIGTDDMGNKFCKADLPPFMCEPGVACTNGSGTCNAEGNDCVCYDDSDCGGFFNHCLFQ